MCLIVIMIKNDDDDDVNDDLKPCPVIFSNNF